MVKPKALFLTNDFGQGSLIDTQVAQWCHLQGFLICLDVDLDLSLVIVFEPLLPDDLARALVPYSLLLQLLALEVKQSKRIFLPGGGVNLEPCAIQYIWINQSIRTI